MSRRIEWVVASVMLGLAALAFLVGYRIGGANEPIPQSCAIALDTGERYITGLEAMVRIKIDYISLISQDYITESEKNFLAEVQDNQIQANDQAVIEYVEAKQDCDKELG